MRAGAGTHGRRSRGRRSAPVGPALTHYRQIVAWDEARAAGTSTSVEARYDLSVSLVDFGWALAAGGANSRLFHELGGPDRP